MTIRHKLRVWQREKKKKKEDIYIGDVAHGMGRIFMSRCTPCSQPCHKGVVGDHKLAAAHCSSSRRNKRHAVRCAWVGCMEGMDEIRHTYQGSGREYEVRAREEEK
jgi:hypothetical protein